MKNFIRLFLLVLFLFNGWFIVRAAVTSQAQPTFIVDTEAERDLAWPEGSIVFCKDTDNTYVLEHTLPIHSWHLLGTGTGSVSGSGTQNFIPKWTSPTNLADSIIYDNDNSVGIGTTNPLNKLHIEGSGGSAGIYFWGSNPTNNTNTLYRNNNTGTGYGHVFWQATDLVDGNSKWTLIGTGPDIYRSTCNVGIGTATPNAALQVIGAISRQSTVLYGSNAGTHVNLAYGNNSNRGVTGASGFNYQYCTLGGGQYGIASDNYATVGGGYDCQANGNSATIGGGNNNSLTGIYSTIGGGANNNSSVSGPYASTTIGGGSNNSVNAMYSTVGGGAVNIISGTGGYSTIGGGNRNYVGGLYSAIIGGWNNNTGLGSNNVVGGGGDSKYGNVIIASASGAIIGGGVHNTISGGNSIIGGGNTNNISSSNSVIGGGSNNISAGSNQNTIGGGIGNSVGNYYSTVAGGYYNRANGQSSVVPGGACNFTDSTYSVAMGCYMQLNSSANRTFVFGNSGTNFGIGTADAFLIDPSSSGINVGIGTSVPIAKLDVVSGSGNSYIARIYNTANDNNADGMLIKLNVGTATTGNCFLVFQNSGVGIGSVKGNGSGGVIFDTVGADYAEYFESEENIEPGLLVGFNFKNGKMRKYQTGDQFIGIVSTAPGFVGNKPVDSNNKYVLVALVGQVDLKETDVIEENRVIRTRDGQNIGIRLVDRKVYLQQ